MTLSGNDGEHFVLWEDDREGDPAIFAQRFAVGGSMVDGNFKVLDMKSDYWASWSSDQNGKAVYVWGSAGDIIGQRFDEDLQAVGDLFLVNGAPWAFQQFPKVQVFGDQIYTIWSDNREPGYGFSVWGNILEWGNPDANNAPVITSSDSCCAAFNQQFTYVAEATDADGHAISYLFANYPDWLTADGPVISGTPTMDAVSTTFSVVASDGNKADSIDVKLSVVPQAFSLSQNYPNPFNPITTIRYSLPEAGKVSLKILDLRGRTVAELVDGFKSAGAYQIEWNAAGFPSGVYLARIKAGKQVQTRKLVLQK